MDIYWGWQYSAMWVVGVPIPASTQPSATLYVSIAPLFYSPGGYSVALLQIKGVEVLIGDSTYHPSSPPQNGFFLLRGTQNREYPYLYDKGVTYLAEDADFCAWKKRQVDVL